MVHGIYLKSKPKNKWQLMSVTGSEEMAKSDCQIILAQAKLEGNEKAEVASQAFNSTFWIPHYLKEIKVQKMMYN